MHDLRRAESDLQESLSSGRSLVAFLIGAGCPLSVRVGPDAAPLIPDMRGLTQLVCERLVSDDAFATLRQNLVDDGKPEPTVEDLLSHARLLRRVVGAGEARGLAAAELDAVEKEMCTTVASAVRRQLPTDHETSYHRFAQWIGGIHRSSAVQVFTTNYDLLLEQALEALELPFFDGFIGATRPFFDLRAIEEEELPARWARVWKLHGSINWQQGPAGSVCRLAAADVSGGGLLIHPSEQKYAQSRRLPYLAMIDRLRAFLRQPSAVLLVSGYSFSDEHINEVLVQGMRGNPTAAAFGLVYGKLSDQPALGALMPSLPTNVSLLARDEASIRGRRGSWLPDPDGSPAPSCELGDFASFAKLLRQLVGA